MDVRRLLELAGIELSEASLAKYNEPKANHPVKSKGMKPAPKPMEGKLGTTKSSKYTEPKANHSVESKGWKSAPKPLEGKGKKPDMGKYAEPKAGSGPKKTKVVNAPSGAMKTTSTAKYGDHNSTKVHESKDWGVKNTGEWDGMSVAQIEAVANKLRAKKDHTAEETRRLKAADMAIRAKKASAQGKKKWKGVKAVGESFEELQAERLAIVKAGPHKRDSEAMKRLNEIDVLSEKSKNWGLKHTGEWDGYTVAQIEKVANKLRDKKSRTKEESRRLRAADVAIRAKKAKGGKWKGVKAKAA